MVIHNVQDVHGLSDLWRVNVRDHQEQPSFLPSFWGTLTHEHQQNGVKIR